MPLRRSNLSIPDTWLKPVDSAESTGGWKCLSLELKTITPMLGGSATQGQADPQQPIRGASVRGHLRYWWRHIYQAQNPRATSAQMFLEEAAIWGSAAGDGGQSSLVRIAVDSAPCERLAVSIHKLRQNHTGLKYATFGMDDNNRALKDGVHFSLQVYFSNKLTDLQKQSATDAIRLWCSFGGIGARTRRGFGAVWVKQSPLPKVSKQEAASFGLIVHCSPNHEADGVSALENLLEKYWKYRQGPNGGRNPGSTHHKPGQTRWPDADVIRALYGTTHKTYTFKHPLRGLPHRLPKAMFGLPVNTVFKNEGSCDGKIFSINPRINNQVKERMASPLIFRPLCQENKWYAAIIQLPTKHLVNLELIVADNSSRTTKVYQRQEWWSDKTAEADKEKILPMKNQRSADPLVNFIEYAFSSNK